MAWLWTARKVGCNYVELMYRRLVRIAALAAALLTTGAALAEEIDVLYWMVDSNAKIETWWDGGEISITEQKDLCPQDSSFAARIRVTGGSIQEGQDVFLDLYIPGYGVDEGGGYWGVEFGDVGGYWGAGVPTGNQSPSEAYAAGSPEYSFIVELGNIDTDDNWTTVATSAAKAYSELYTENYIHKTFDMSPSTLAAWTPVTFTAVPEPSSGLLTALGLALLALRRKKFGKGA